MAISVQTALAVGLSVIGHTGVLIAATWVPPHAHAAKPPVEIAIIAAKPLPMGVSAAGAAPEVARASSRPASRSRVLTQPVSEAVVAPQAVAAEVEEPKQASAAAVDTPAVEASVQGVTGSAPGGASFGSTSGGAASGGGNGTSVSAKPRYRTNPPPDYPVAARRRHEQGTVWLRVTVTEAGRATDVVVERTCGFATLDASALDAVRSWAFDAAVRDGVRVDSSVLVPVRFALDH